MKTNRLEIRLDPKERALAERLAERHGMTVSELLRMLIKAASASSPDALPTALVLDRQTLVRYVRSVRALGNLMNQSAHALNSIAKAVREAGVNSLDLTEALESVAYGLAEIKADAEEVRRHAAELNGMPVVLGE